MGVLKVALVACMAIIFWVVAFKSRMSSVYVVQRSWHIFPIVLGSVLLLALNAVFLNWLYRLSVALRRKMTWSRRRWRAVLSTGVKAATVDINLLTALAENAAILVRPECLCHVPVALTGLALARWIGWSFIALVMLLDAHGCMLHPMPGRPDSIVQDLPLSFHWPKFVVCIVLAGARFPGCSIACLHGVSELFVAIAAHAAICCDCL